MSFGILTEGLQDFMFAFELTVALIIAPTIMAKTLKTHWKNIKIRHNLLLIIVGYIFSFGSNLLSAYIQFSSYSVFNQEEVGFLFSLANFTLPLAIAYGILQYNLLGFALAKDIIPLLIIGIFFELLNITIVKKTIPGNAVLLFILISLTLLISSTRRWIEKVIAEKASQKRENAVKQLARFRNDVGNNTDSNFLLKALTCKPYEFLEQIPI